MKKDCLFLFFSIAIYKKNEPLANNYNVVNN